MKSTSSFSLPTIEGTPLERLLESGLGTDLYRQLNKLLNALAILDTGFRVFEG
jgi:hypothetical protein